jgi:DNA polymerase III epsilon subunit-like protein
MWYFHEHQERPLPSDFKLATLCQYFGVAFHAASAHEALADVSATVSLYRALVQRGNKPFVCQPTTFQESSGNGSMIAR